MASRKSPRRAKPASAGRAKSQPIPNRIFAQVSPRSVGGVSMFESPVPIDANSIGHFASEDDVIQRARARLEEAGFEILDVNRVTINIAGKKSTFEKAFSTEIYAEERACRKGEAEDTATFIDAKDAPMPGLIQTKGTAFAEVVEGVAIEVPRYYMASALPPSARYWHLDVPADVSLGCNADRAHRAGYTGRGVNVAMVDSGWYRHPFFVGRGYRALPVILGPGAADPLRDENGHGTGESANIFAVAPDVTLQMVKMNFVNSIGAFNAAVNTAPQVITCSWGSDKRFGPLFAADMALAAAIAAAVANGIVVVFSAGNGHWGFPGQHPDVISAGGVFMANDGALRASDYSSGFMSNIYPGRRVPDLCGLVGMRPRAAYIMLPVEPADSIDVGLSGGVHPNADETTNKDGWAAFSGTSAAAPQLAGAAALLRQACPRLSPATVRKLLQRTARDVTVGSTHPNTGSTAGPGVDNATGHGLVDAHRAALLARLHCLGPASQSDLPVSEAEGMAGDASAYGLAQIRPILPILPIQPIRPPILPIRPIRPPIFPIRPPIFPPILPPIRPPIRPFDAGQAGQEGICDPASAAAQFPTTTPSLSSEEVEALEDMIVRGELGEPLP